MIRNLSLTLENIADSAARPLAAQENPLDSLAKVVFDNRIALDYLLADQKRCLCCGQMPPATPGLMLLGKLKLYVILLSKPLGLKGDSLNRVFL